MKQHSVKYNFIMNFILSASQFIFPLITFPYISRILLAEGNGKITFATSVANYFLMVASLGIPTYGIRACAQVRNDRIKLSKTVHELLIINSITTLLVIITYVICIFAVPRFRTDASLFWINGINIVLNIVGMNWLFQALEQYDYITIRSLIFKAISVFLMIIFVRKEQDYLIYGVITVFAAVGSNLFNLLRARCYIDFKWIGNYELIKHLKPILILFAQSVAVSIYTNLDSVMLGFMKTDVDVGYYSAAVKIKTVLVSLVSSLGNVLLPRMSYYAKAGKENDFLMTMQEALNFTLLMSFSLAAYFSLFSDECIRFLAGNGYTGAVIAMQIITIAVIPIGVTGVLGVQVLTAIEKEKYVLYSVIVGAVLDFVLNLIFIPIWGAAGAALATTVAEFCVLIVQLFFTRELMFRIRKELRGHIYLILTSISIVLSSGAKYLTVSSAFLKLIVSAAIFFITYGIGLFVVRDEFIVKIISVATKKIKKKREN